MTAFRILNSALVSIVITYSLTASGVTVGDPMPDNGTPVVWLPTLYIYLNSTFKSNNLPGASPYMQDTCIGSGCGYVGGTGPACSGAACWTQLYGGTDPYNSRVDPWATASGVTSSGSGTGSGTSTGTGTASGSGGSYSTADAFIQAYAYKPFSPYSASAEVSDAMSQASADMAQIVTELNLYGGIPGDVPGAIVGPPRWYDDHKTFGGTLWKSVSGTNTLPDIPPNPSSTFVTFRNVSSAADQKLRAAGISVEPDKNLRFGYELDIRFKDQLLSWRANSYYFGAGYSTGTGLQPVRLVGDIPYYFNPSLALAEPQMGLDANRMAIVEGLRTGFGAALGANMGSDSDRVFKAAQRYDRGYYIGIQTFKESTGRKPTLPAGPMEALNAITGFRRSAYFNFQNNIAPIDGAYRAGFLEFYMPGEISDVKNGEGKPIFAPSWAYEGPAPWKDIHWLGAKNNITIIGDYQQLINLQLIDPLKHMAITYVNANFKGQDLMVIPTNHPDRDMYTLATHELWWGGLDAEVNFLNSPAGRQLLLSGTDTEARRAARNALDSLQSALSTGPITDVIKDLRYYPANFTSTNNAGVSIANEVIAGVFEPVSPAATNIGAKTNFAYYLIQGGEKPDRANQISDFVANDNTAKKIYNDITTLAKLMNNGTIK